ncbi:MAG: hypothetical protein ACYC3B_01105 [Sedimentisphaerales bacterium]
MRKKEAKKQRGKEAGTVAQKLKGSLHPYVFTSLFPFFCSSSKLKSTPDDLKKMEFSTSSQRLGISFTDKIRNVFRHKWVKKAN